MPDTIDMKEDGEIESDEADEVYTKLERPKTTLQPVNNAARPLYNSDCSVSSDSDGDSPTKKFPKRLEKPQQASSTSASRSKNGFMWKNMIQEESLMENLKTCDVSASLKRKHERGAESYDFEQHRKKSEDDEGFKSLKRRKMDVSENDSSSSNGSARSAKRAKNNFNKRNKRSPKILPDLVVPQEGSDDDFSRDLAQKLEEENLELIQKTVSVIGRKLCANLFKITQKIERDGGMMTMNKFRRRTPGGIFLFLLKTSDKIDEESKNEIFHPVKSSNTEKGIADRKMSSEQSEAKDPPNSPANPEFIETNGKITDPDLVSQKILNFSKPERETTRANEEVLELDYNYDDMDTF